MLCGPARYGVAPFSKSADDYLRTRKVVHGRVIRLPGTHCADPARLPHYVTVTQCGNLGRPVEVTQPGAAVDVDGELPGEAGSPRRHRKQVSARRQEDYSRRADSMRKLRKKTIY
jgi:hypothetical protein